MIFRLIALCLIFGFLAPHPARAESPVVVILYKVDPKAKDGFTETYRWRMGRSDEWRRFEYMTSKMDKGKKEDINPFAKKPAELLVMSVKEENGVTGKDYYLSPDGIMVTSIHTRSTYYQDTHNFQKLLKEELDNRSSFEKFPGDRYANDTPGIVARYKINENLPNPSWLVNSQKDVNLYDSFLRELKQQSSGTAAHGANSQYFEKKGNYVLLLNYPAAPAKFATIGAKGIRLSNTYSDDIFLKDDKNYFKFFYNMTQDSKKIINDTNAKDKDVLEKGQF